MCTHCVEASKIFDTLVAAAACLLTAVCRVLDAICAIREVEDAACGPGSSCDRTMLMDNYDRQSIV